MKKMIRNLVLKYKIWAICRHMGIRPSDLPW
jgi:hypothetical protein